MRLVDADRIINNVNSCETLNMDTIMSIIEDTPTIYPMFSNRMAGKTVLAEYVGMCKVLDNFGLNSSDPVATLKFVLDQYQKIICEATNGKFSKLSYDANVILSCINDILNEAADAEKNNGKWLVCTDNFHSNIPLQYGKCSYCGHTESIGMVDRIDYCPKCGTKLLRDVKE